MILGGWGDDECLGSRTAVLETQTLLIKAFPRNLWNGETFDFRIMSLVRRFWKGWLLGWNL